MIDTVTLLVPKGGYKILEIDDFKPSFEPFDCFDEQQVNEFLRKNKGSLRYRQNPDRSFRRQGKVYPNLTIDEIYLKEKEEYYCNLQISFSCPKLLWGQSFDEVANKDFPQVVNTLAARLKDMDVIVSASTLTNAIVTRVDFCKNYDYPSMGHARALLDRLRKCSFPQLETDLTRFANDGRAVRFHSDKFEVIFYLKYYDLLEPLKRAVDRLRTKQEIAKAAQLKQKKIIPPVVRMEARFIGKPSVNSHLYSALGVTKARWTFKEIFKEAYSNKTRLYQWEKITSNKYNFALLTQKSEADLCRKALDVKNKRPREIFEGLGLYFALKTLGVPELKTTFSEHWNEDTWYEKAKQFTQFAFKYLEPDTTFTDLMKKV